MIYLLISYLLLLIIASYYLFGKNITHPNFLLYIGGELVIILSKIMTDYYNYTITSPIYSFFFFFYTFIFLFSLLYIFVFRKSNLNNDNKLDVIHCKYNRVLFLGMINLVLFCFVLIDYIKVANVSSLNNLSEIIYNYRIGSKQNEIGISFLSNQFIKFLRASCYISIYMMISEIFKKNKKTKLSKIIYLLLTFILPDLLISLLEGQRYSIGLILVYSIVLWYFMFNNKQHKILSFVKLLIISLIAFELFSLSRLFIGRGGTSSTLIYLGHYFGTSIICFDSWFCSGILDFGKNHGLTTFFGITNILGDFKLLDVNNYSSISYFVFLNGEDGYRAIGNVFTSISFYLRDFGIFGIFIYAFLISFISSSLFYSKKIYIGNINLSTLIYSYISGHILLESYTSGFLGNLFSLDFIINILFMSLILLFLVGKKKKIIFSSNRLIKERKI